MLTSNRTPLLAAIGVLAVVLAGCGGSDKPAPSPSKISAAMRGQPRIIETMTGTSLHRVVVDAKAGYQAYYAPSGQLVDMVKHGVEYRLLAGGGGCYGRYKAGPVRAQYVWVGTVNEIVASRYRVKVSGSTALYYDSQGYRMTVDPRTDLILSSGDSFAPSTGVPHETVQLSYPSSVPEQPTPTNICASSPLLPYRRSK